LQIFVYTQTLKYERQIIVQKHKY